MNLNIKLDNLTDIINLKFGVYSPLNEFNDKDDFINIVNYYKTKNLNFFHFQFILMLIKSI